MFLRPKETLHLPLYYIRRGFRLSNVKNFHLTYCAFLRKVSSTRRNLSEIRSLECESSVAGIFSSEQPRNINDNFFGIESDEGVIVVQSEPTSSSSVNKPVTSNLKQEKFNRVRFGAIRYDNENKPVIHGQFESGEVRMNPAIEKDRILLPLKMRSQFNDKQEQNIEVPSKHAKNSNTSEISNQNTNSKLTSASNLTEMNDGISQSDNFAQIKYHQTMKDSVTTTQKSSYIDQMYFSDKLEESDTNSNLKSSSSFDDMSSYIDNHYFNSENSKGDDLKYTAGNVSITEKNHTIHIHENPSMSTEEYEKLSLLDQQYSDNGVHDSLKTIADEYINPASRINKVESEIKNCENEKNSNKSLSFFDENFFCNASIQGNSITEVKFADKENLPSKNVSLNQEIESYIHKDLTNNVNYTLPIDENAQTGIVNNFNLNACTIPEQLSVESRNFETEKLEKFDEILTSSSVHFPSKKNNFLFQNSGFSEKISQATSNNTSQTIKSHLIQKDLELESSEESDFVEKKSIPNKMVQDVKIQKETLNEEKPKTAYDFAKKLRNEKKQMDPQLINGKFVPKSELYDSKGFRILKNQVPNLMYYTRDEILDLLTKNVLYSDDDLVVLNKPYNLVIHESKTVKDACLSQYLDDLAAELDKQTHKPKLFTVHRLDKETSGCLLLARNETSALKLKSLFAQRKIVKTYWIVTVQVPDPTEGVIDIPISEGSIDNRARMVLHPNLPKDLPYQNHSKSGKRAVTHYKVISESGNAALVEVRPETGIKHQIRVHFGFGLSCPILGDHKYSHLDKLAPQKLQSDLLQRLHIRQSKVRHVPMHIYARSVWIPGYKDGKNLHVMAPMPVHMSKNLQKLKFRKK